MEGPQEKFKPTLVGSERVQVQAQNISRTTKVVVASTVMLSFITYWRAAAIVLCDLGSSAFYAGGIAEGFVGKELQS